MLAGDFAPAALNKTDMRELSNSQSLTEKAFG